MDLTRRLFLYLILLVVIIFTLLIIALQVDTPDRTAERADDNIERSADTVKTQPY